MEAPERALRLMSFRRMMPMISQVFFAIRRAALLALLLCASHAGAIDVWPSPSYDGNYTVYWDTPLGCYEEYYDPFYLVHCYSLQENGVDVAWSGNWLQALGEAPGSYTYYVYYRLYVYGQPYDEYIVEGPVTVDVL
jgi:hypothetical protein